MSEAVAPTETEPEIAPVVEAPPEVKTEAPTGPSQWDTLQSALPDELRKDKYFDQFKGKDDAIQRVAIEAKTSSRLIGSQDRIHRPNEESPKEEWDTFYGAMGRPETAADYDLQGFEPTEGTVWDENLQTTMVGAMHEAGLNSNQVNKLLRVYEGINAAAFTGSQEAIAAQTAEAQNKLKADWGTDYDARVELVAQVFNGAPEEAQEFANLTLADGTPVGDHPAARRFVAYVAGNMREGAFIKGRGPAELGLTPDGAQEKIKELERNVEFMKDAHDETSANYAENSAKLKGLFAAAYPKKP